MNIPNKNSNQTKSKKHLEKTSQIDKIKKHSKLTKQNWKIPVCQNSNLTKNINIEYHQGLY